MGMRSEAGPADEAWRGVGANRLRWEQWLDSFRFGMADRRLGINNERRRTDACPTDRSQKKPAPLTEKVDHDHAPRLAAS
jgi:hypothetical protein